MSEPKDLRSEPGAWAETARGPHTGIGRRSGATADDAPCRSCGACCAFSREWPRFTLEDDAELARIPTRFVDRRLARMRCDADRCSALTGEVGVSTSCQVYDDRPHVCRACEPGDDACRMARARFGLEAL